MLNELRNEKAYKEIYANIREKMIVFMKENI
jgi:hypothetical protein